MNDGPQKSYASSSNLSHAAALLIKILVVANVAIAGSVCFALELQSTPCDESVLPTGVKQVLQKQFSSWHVLMREDLSLEDQRRWQETKSGKCPGIAVGNFEPATSQSYALLLVRRAAKTNDIKLVVLVKGAHGVYQPQLVDDSDRAVHGQVIYKVPPAKYSPDAADASQGIQLVRDGFKIEQIGVGATLYFWEDGRYIKSFMSKGYSEVGK